MSQRQPTKDEQDFVRVVKAAAALGVGTMTAFIFSLKQIHPSIELSLGFGAILAGLVATAATWKFCGVLFQAEFIDASDGLAAQAASRKKTVLRSILLFLGISGLLTVAAFAYAMKDVSWENQRAVIEGTILAALVLGIVGFLIYKAVRFFEEQSEAELEQLCEDRLGEDAED